MRRLSRRAFDVAAVGSALLFAAICMLWVRGLWARDELLRVGRAGFYELVASRGAVGFRWCTTPLSGYWDSLGWQHSAGRPAEPVRLEGPPPPAYPAYASLFGGEGPSPPYYRLYFDRLGFGFETRGNGYVGGPPSHLLIVPLWAAAGLAALLPLGWARGRWRRRIPHGHCPRCGYDLRATPRRCPECGAAPAAGKPGRRTQPSPQTADEAGP